MAKYIQVEKGVKERVGEMIRETRKAKGLTQKELGEKLGISESAVSKYESGKENPTAELIQKVADALGVSLEIRFK